VPRSHSKRSIGTSVGSDDAGLLVELNDDGAVDPTMLNMTGAAWPATPSDGQLYFNTSITDPELFAFDSATGDWLSVHVREHTFTAATSAGGAQSLDVPGAGATS